MHFPFVRYMDTMPYKHGLSRLRLYGIHGGMMSRCYNPKNNQYPNYGGRGITVDPSLHDVEDYCRWFRHKFNMPDLPTGSTMDRINNDLGYMDNNLRIATQKQQQNNRGNNRLITFRGETRTLKQWAEHLGIKQATLSIRLNKYGWSPKRALTTPVRPLNPIYTIEGITGTLEEIGKHFNLHPDTLADRIRQGKPPLRFKYKIGDFWGTLKEISVRFGINPKTLSARKHYGIPLVTEDEMMRVQGA